MEHILHYDPIEELRHSIDRQHLGYLQSEKRENERSLEALMKDFLCKTPHNSKFSCLQTAQVLRRSVLTRQDFNGERAAKAFGVLAKYADNLILQPWRKEFREIKLYGGFYTHKVEAALVGAEQMLEVMGYQHTGNSTMMLPGVLDPDRAISVSKDAMLAMVECNIMQQIWEALSKHRVSWSEILYYREHCVSAPEHAIRTLTYHAHEKLYQQQMPHRSTHCGYSAYYGNHALHHPSHSYHVPKYAHVVSSQQIVPQPVPYQSPILPSFSQQQILRPHEMYPSNGYHSHNVFPSLSQPPPPPNPPYNGYAMHSHGHFSHQRPAVPTAQLIELHPDVHPQVHRPYPVPEPFHTTQFPSSKAKDDGAGSWENWDNVYRNLANQGYRTDNNSPNDDDIDEELGTKMHNVNITSSGRNKQQLLAPLKRPDTYPRTDGDGEAKQRNRKNSNDLDEIVPKQRLSKPILKNICDETNARLEKPTVDQVDSYAKKRVDRNVDLSSNEERNRNTNLSEDPKSADRPNSSTRVESNRVVTLDVSPSFLREVSPVVDLPPEGGKWECVTCTFFNSQRKNICEMCGKSRDPGVEQIPQPCGGQVCPQCTLVNKKGKNFCDVCGTKLKNSPTYI